MDTISGNVEKILFKNEENGYAAVKIKIKKGMPKAYEGYFDDDIIVVTSYFHTFPCEQELLELKGNFVSTKYGFQFKAEEVTWIKKETKEAVVNYLSSDLFPGIGKALANKIYKKLGSDCLEIIRKNPDILDTIEGISLVQKDTIVTHIEENHKKEKDIMDLLHMGLTMKMARKIVVTLNRKEVQEVKDNPYLLIDLVDGFGFLKADKLALENNMSPSDPRRIRACVFYYIKKVTIESGNTFVAKDYLLEKVITELMKENTIVSQTEIEEVIEYLSYSGKIVIEDDNVYEYTVYAAEGKLSTNIACRIKYKAKKISMKRIEKAYLELTKENNIEYSLLQEQAIKECFNQNIMIITGGPGTGKTTIVKAIVEMYKKLNKSLNGVELLAPTGRAGKRLNEVTGIKAQTIHRFLGYDGKNFRYNENEKALADFIIIDEMSMVDTILANQLFQAIPIKTKVLIVGDVDQIPSVSPGKVLKDLITSNKIKVIALEQIHRQAKDSTIISLAHSINNGIIPEDIIIKQKDRSFIYMLDENDILKAIVQIVKQAMMQNMTIEKDIQILAPMYKGILGIDSINRTVQAACNGNYKEEIKYGNQIFRINDKVIQLVNRPEDGIMNGDIGIIKHFNYVDDRIDGIQVDFDGHIVSYSYDNYEELKLAYAISIHKSQGSEFHFTILPLTKRYNIMLQKQLYYTAITRSKKFLVMIGDIEALKIACSHNGYERQTKLKEKIIKACEEETINLKDFETSD